ncbi:MAG: CoA pyrophosphatase [Azovibrio sp.]|uniref:CoA pyrophosphatase n=1 Tax=Azovibrio sp. TaxID=1872673 RepID=UPI003C710298
MDLQQLESRLLASPEGAPAEGDQGAGEENLTPAAVLVPLVHRPEGYQMLLTRRTDHLRDHPGQISFPGGRMELDDASPVHAALREAEEEIGLAAHLPRVLGYLPPYRTGTGFKVFPVVALLEPPFDLSLDDFEVAEVFEVPLDFLLDPGNHRQEKLYYRGALREYTAMPYGDHFIWGATAGMILSLYRRLHGL